LTVSIGIASFPSDANSAPELVQKADKALYAAKEQGKNRVCVSDSPSVD
jgi:diguanylate cyclase (GGDEF)-like protein